MKKFLFNICILAFLLSVHTAEASTCGVTSTGGNWNSAATWFNCGGSTPTTGDAIVASSTSGNLAVNVNTANLASIDFANTSNWGGTLSGASTMTVVGVTGTTQNIIFSSAMTQSWTGVLAMSNTSATAQINLTTNGKALNSINQTSSSGSSLTQLQDSLTTSAATTRTITLTTGGFDLNGNTISGNSASNRVLITSGGLGTSKVVLLNGGTFANADFRDISFNNGGSDLDLSAITGNSGDCGGNAMSGGGVLTFTSSATQTYSGSTSFSWSNAANWTSRTPLCQDDVVINGAFSSGRTITADMPRLGRDIDMSAATWTGTALTYNNNVGQRHYGSWAFSTNGGTGTMNWSNNNGWGFQGRGGSYTFDSGGVSIGGSVTLETVSGSVTLTSALTHTAGNFNFSSGTFNDGGWSFIGLLFTNNSGFGRTLTRSGTWTLNGTGTTYNTTSSNLTQNDTGTIVISNTSTTAKTFAGGSLSGANAYNNLTITGQDVAISGSNTFTGTLDLSTAGRLYTDPTLFTQSTTQTVENFTVNSTSTVDRVMASSTTATNATLTKSGGGNVCVDYVMFQDLTGSPSPTWYAGTNSVDSGSSNVNISFTACPGGGGGGASFVEDFWDDY